MPVDRLAVRVSVPRRNRPPNAALVLVETVELDRLESEHEQMTAVCRAVTAVLYHEPIASDGPWLSELRMRLDLLPDHLLYHNQP